MFDIPVYQRYPFGMLEQSGEFVRQIYSVSDLNAYIRALLESNENLMNIWIEGEVSNLSKPRSGHIYFTLKDMDASVRCVIWRVHANRLAGVFRDGMRVERQTGRPDVLSCVDL